MAENGVGLSRSDVIAPARGGEETRGRHAERSEQPGIQEIVEPLTGDRLDRLRQYDRAEVGIDEGVTWLAEQGRRIDQRQRLLARLRFGVERSPGRHARRVHEEVTHCHALLVRASKRRYSATSPRFEARTSRAYQRLTCTAMMHAGVRTARMCQITLL